MRRRKRAQRKMCVVNKAVAPSARRVALDRWRREMVSRDMCVQLSREAIRASRGYPGSR
jgi:hypothetical protein